MKKQLFKTIIVMILTMGIMLEYSKMDMLKLQYSDFKEYFNKTQNVPKSTKSKNTFEIISPSANSKVDNTKKIKITWRKHPQAKTYKTFILNEDAKKYSYGYASNGTAVSIPAYTLSGSCNQTIKVYAYNSNKKQIAVASRKIVTTKSFPKPGSFSINASVTNNTLNYSWTSAKYAAYYEYRIYDNTTKKYVLSSKYGLSAKRSFKNMDASHQYTLYVTAYNGNPYLSKTVKCSNATKTRYTHLSKKISCIDASAPKVNTSTNTSNVLQVKWKKCVGATKYYIYSRDTKTNKFTHTYYTEGTSYTLPQYMFTSGSKQSLSIMATDKNDKVLAYRTININITGKIEKPKNFEIKSIVDNTKVSFAAVCDNATHYYYSLKDLTTNKYIINPTVKKELSTISRDNLTDKHKYEITVVACNGNCYKSKTISYNNLDSARITKKVVNISILKTTTDTNKTASANKDVKPTSTPTPTSVASEPSISVAVNSLKRSNNTYTMSLGDAKLQWDEAEGATYYLDVYNATDKKTTKIGTVLTSYCTDKKYVYTLKKSLLDYGKKYQISIYYQDETHKRTDKNPIVDKFNLQIKAYIVKIGGAHGDYDDKPGDSKGNETSIANFNNSWVHVIRAKNATVANRLAYVCEWLCDNNNVNVGYTQNTSGTWIRTSLFNAMKSAKGDLTKLKGKKYDADCSSFVSTCLYYALLGVSESWANKITMAYDTNGLETILVNNSTFKEQFEVVQDLTKDTKKTNIDYTQLKKGDILLRSKRNQARVGKTWGHTEIVVSVVC